MENIKKVDMIWKQITDLLPKKTRVWKFLD